MTKCPECGGVLDIEEGLEQGDTLSCADCAADLEVVGTNPLELSLLEDFEEDEWSEDEDEADEADDEEKRNGFR